MTELGTTIMGRHPTKALVYKVQLPRGPRWVVQLPGYANADLWPTFELARQWVADWVDGKVQ